MNDHTYSPMAVISLARALNIDKDVLALRVGTTARTVARWMAGTSTPRCKHIDKMRQLAPNAVQVWEEVHGAPWPYKRSTDP